MSDPKQHVTSLEMSRALAEGGVERESLFTRLCFEWEREWRLMQTVTVQRYRERKPLGEFETLPAYTASELGAMLPKDLPFTAEIGQNENGTSYVEREAGLCVIHYEGQWEIFYIRNGRNITALPRGTADTEADARAALLLALIDAEHVDPETLTHA